MLGKFLNNDRLKSLLLLIGLVLLFVFDKADKELLLYIGLGLLYLDSRINSLKVELASLKKTEESKMA